MRALIFLTALAALPAGGQTQPADAQADGIISIARDRMNRQNDVWFKDGDYPAIIHNQSVMVEVEPKDEETFSNLIWMLGNVERFDEAWLTAKRFGVLNSSYVDANYYEAEYFFGKRMFAKIPALLEPAISQPKHPDANLYRFLAISYKNLGYLSDAVRVWELLLKAYPNDAQTKANIAAAKKKLGKG